MSRRPAGAWLPGSILLGVGVAVSFPVLSAAAVAGLPSQRYSIGGALNQTARPIGAVLGVAVLVAVVGRPGSLGRAQQRFHVAWLVCAGVVVASSAVSLLQPRRGRPTLADDLPSVEPAPRRTA